MRTTKWLFYAFIGAVALMVIAFAISLRLVPPRDPDTLYVAYTANLKSLDPAVIQDTESAAVVGNVFETLYNYEYGVRPYKIFPQVASAMPEISADGKTWTIKLRRGIRFYDPTRRVFADGIGNEIKAADVVYSWKRVCNSKAGETGNYSSIFEGKIEGLTDWWDYTAKAASSEAIDWDRPISGLQALDDYTVRIQLTEAYPQLLYNLAHMPTSIVCRPAVEKLGRDFDRTPIGSGPFYFEEERPEQRVVLRANPTYRGRPDIDGGVEVPAADRLPHIKRIEFGYFPQDLPRWIRFRDGQLDRSGIPKESFSQAIRFGGELTDEMRRDGVILRKEPDPSVYYIGFNMNDAVVGRNKPLRQAMSMAFDREKYIRIYSNGRGEPANGPLPPSFPAYDPTHINPYTKFNLAAARAKMEEARRINGGSIPALTVYMGDTDTSARQEVEFFISQMSQIGLRINPVYKTWAEHQEVLNKYQAQMFYMGWVADYPDGQTFLQLFSSRMIGSSGLNLTAYKNPEYDALFDRASLMVEGPQRDALYLKMQELVCDDCPVLFTTSPVVFGLRYNWVKNYEPMDYGNGRVMYMMYASIDTKAREAWFKRH